MLLFVSFFALISKSCYVLLLLLTIHYTNIIMNIMIVVMFLHVSKKVCNFCELLYKHNAKITSHKIYIIFKTEVAL